MCAARRTFGIKWGRVKRNELTVSLCRAQPRFRIRAHGTWRFFFISFSPPRPRPLFVALRCIFLFPIWKKKWTNEPPTPCDATICRNATVTPPPPFMLVFFVLSYRFFPLKRSTTTELVFWFWNALLSVEILAEGWPSFAPFLAPFRTGSAFEWIRSRRDSIQKLGNSRFKCCSIKVHCHSAGKAASQRWRIINVDWRP